jgi:DNA replication initiation complex subunit (GINS family)
MYDQLYAAWRREVDDPTLGGLPPDFYEKIVDYLAHIKEEKNKPADKKTVKTNLMEHEARNVERMLEELLDLRYRKILKTITRLHKAPAELLSNEEAKMCESFVGFADTYQRFAKNLMGGEQTPITVTIIQPSATQTAQAAKTEYKPPTHVTHKRLTLRFTKAIPAIMGADMKSYGPFAPEDVASLPALNAQILIKQGLAVLIEVS